MELIDGINCIYGPPASGKTNLCLFAASRSGGKVIFIDTENTFSAKRIRDFNPEVNLDNIYLIKVDSFERQGRVIRELELLKSADLVIIDSLTKYYRKELQDRTNPDILGQFRLLRSLYKAKECKILITSQVYTSLDNRTLPVGGKLIRDFSRQLIRLSQEKDRVLKILKPEEKELRFRIHASSIDFV